MLMKGKRAHYEVAFDKGEAERGWLCGYDEGAGNITMIMMNKGVG